MIHLSETFEQKAPKLEAIYGEDGAVKEIHATEPLEAGVEEPDTEVPFHLDNLRKHLASVQLARRVLPEDVAARQKLLEESVFDIATARLKHESDLFSSLGLNNTTFKDTNLRSWLWQWHQKLELKIKQELARMMEMQGHESAWLVAYRMCYVLTTRHCRRRQDGRPNPAVSHSVEAGNHVSPHDPRDSKHPRHRWCQGRDEDDPNAAPDRKGYRGGVQD